MQFNYSFFTSTLPYKTCMELGSGIQAYTKHALFMQSIIRFTSYVEQSISNCSMQHIQIFILQFSFRKTKKKTLVVIRNKLYSLYTNILQANGTRQIPHE